ncbi:hypothetical protein [Streptomyces sp. 150FB]|uniref:hypothetical protein n=1 Tax=Streptomyces sp. 150FB TaxID=1576605 RepID=UPI000AAEFA07|nr:hypothetical protein [Streptomyces sp. 150FB]
MQPHGGCGRATAVVLNGLTLGTLWGMPPATFVDERLGWRAVFWIISALTVVAALRALAGCPSSLRGSDHRRSSRGLSAGFRASGFGLRVSGPSSVEWVVGGNHPPYRDPR